MQQQPFTGTQTASVPILSTLALPPASRLAATKISNINAPLRQKQQQQLRVNTGEDLAVLTGG